MSTDRVVEGLATTPIDDRRSNQVYQLIHLGTVERLTRPGGAPVLAFLLDVAHVVVVDSVGSIANTSRNHFVDHNPPHFHAIQLGLPGLRALPIGRHPYLMSYVGRDDVVDVWRLLHTSRDISATLHDSAGD